MTQQLKIGPRMKAPPKLALGRLNQWVRSTAKGARIAYHVGDLANDRDQVEPAKPGDTKLVRTFYAADINRQARAALQYSDDGYVVLCQIPIRRDDGSRANGYHYVAVRTDKQFKEKANG